MWMYDSSREHNYTKGMAQITLLNRHFDNPQESAYLIKTDRIALQAEQQTTKNEEGNTLVTILNSSNVWINKVDQYSGEETKVEDIEKELFDFRGAIIGYPFHKLIIKEKTYTIECDVVEIVGGRKNKPPYLGTSEFRVNFYRLEHNGVVSLIKKDSNRKLFIEISIREKVGQIIGKGTQIFCPSDLMDFVNKCKRSYMGRPYHKWDEALGNICTNSEIKKLKITFEPRYRVAKLNIIENLDTQIYKVHSNSSMDPWDDECCDTTDRHLWAIFRYNEESLNQFISNVHRIALFKSPEILFLRSIRKTEFELHTGIFLFESIIKTHTRY